MSYKKSNTTIDKILVESRRLFYEKGYVATHYDDLSAATYLSPGLIHYHFRKKEKIAAAIYNDLLEESLQICKDIFSDKNDYLVVKAISIRLSWRLFYENEHFRRFLIEISEDGIPTKYSEENFNEYFQFESEQYSLFKSSQYIRLISRLSGAISVETILSIGKKELDMSEEEIADTEIKLIYSLMGFHEEKIIEIIEVSRNLFQNYKVIMEDNFKIKTT